MNRTQVSELARDLKVSSETEAEMQIAWMMRRERFNETGEHTHECPGCGRHWVCIDSAHVTDRAYMGEPKGCGCFDGDEYA